MRLQKLISLWVCGLSAATLPPAVAASGLVPASMSTSLIAMFAAIAFILLLLIGLGSLAPDSPIGQKQSEFALALMLVLFSLVFGLQPWGDS